MRPLDPGHFGRGFFVGSNCRNSTLADCVLMWAPPPRRPGHDKNPVARKAGFLYAGTCNRNSGFLIGRGGSLLIAPRQAL
jgi:hypothetical protein